MAFLRRWNRLALLGWLFAPPAALFTYLVMWGGVSIHGPPRPDHRPYVGGLSVLVACGVLGSLAAAGVGRRRGERPRGRILGALLVPVGFLAAWALVLHLRTFGLPG